MLKVKLFPTGRKNQINYRIVVSEAKSKREGKYLESLGYYNPLANPPIIKADKSKYLDWLQKGAQPTRTVRLMMEKI